VKRRGGGGGGGALELAAGVPILKLRASKALRSAPRKMALMVLLHCSDRLCTRMRLWPYGVVYKTAHYSLIESRTQTELVRPNGRPSTTSCAANLDRRLGTILLGELALHLQANHHALITCQQMIVSQPVG